MDVRCYKCETNLNKDHIFVKNDVISPEDDIFNSYFPDEAETKMTGLCLKCIGTMGIWKDLKVRNSFVKSRANITVSCSRCKTHLTVAKYRLSNTKVRYCTDCYAKISCRNVDLSIFPLES